MGWKVSDVYLKVSRGGAAGMGACVLARGREAIRDSIPLVHFQIETVNAPAVWRDVASTGRRGIITGDRDGDARRRM